MSKEFVNGISFKFGSMKIIYRDAREVKVTKQHVTFRTKVTCLGNNVIPVHNDLGEVIGERRVYSALSSSTMSGIEHIIDNPIYLEYAYLDSHDTKVTAHLNHIDEYEMIAGY
jgi:hypothetical protein